MAALLCVAMCARVWAADAPSLNEQLTEHLNLGKAFYENPTTQNEAVAEFKKALDLRPNSVREQLNYGLALLRAAKTADAVSLLRKVQQEDPSLPHTWFNLGIYYKRDGQFDQAIEQLQGMTRLVPREPITHYNLGTIYKLQNKLAEAQREFESARDLNPSLAAPHFQLFNLYRQQQRLDDAKRELALFNERKKAQDTSATPEDVEWCEYAEIYEPLTSEPDRLQTPLRVSFSTAVLTKLAQPDRGGLVVLDTAGNGHADLLAYTPAGIQVFRNGTAPASATGLESVRDVVDVKPGDFNNDGLVDLCVLTRTGAFLYQNAGGGKFVPSPFTLPQEPMNAAVWIDFDHDYDLDLILLGTHSMLLRNQGPQGFVPHPFPFAEGEALDGVAFRLVADSKSKDLAVTYREHAAVLYRDQLTATYIAEPLSAIPAAATHLLALDLDNDGSLDLTYEANGREWVARNLRSGLADSIAVASAPATFADFDNRGFYGIAAANGLSQGLGRLQFVPAQPAAHYPAWRSAAVADFDGDGKVDLAAIAPDGTLSVALNRTATTNQWLRVQINGVKNLKVPVGSEVEAKAGQLYQKRIYNGLPVLFGLDGRHTVDTVRITWPNGLIQNEMSKPVGRDLAFREAQRLSGSCPLIFVWNGREFQYVTDVLGVAPLGAMSGDGQFFPTDHTEYVALDGSWLSPKRDAAGQSPQFTVKLTEELSEVSYFDQVRLLAIDHPAATEVYSNEKWKSPPFPAFRLYSLTRRVYPVSARTAHGDVLARLLHRDRQYVDDFRRNYVGVAETHTLDLDFGHAATGNRAFLVLNGWVDWADGSTFLQQNQERRDLTPPYLQVKDKAGRWVTVIPDMGMPSGKPKTIAVDLTGKFLSASRQVRIVTNLCVFWDEIFLGEDSGRPQTVIADLTPSRADLHFRGFSPSHIHPERKQPESFDFSPPSPTSYWNPTPGRYTRYGDVTELTRDIDDRLVVMGSGDQLTLQFDPAQLPPLRPGWRRDYLLRVEGWAKDRDANTAYSQGVEPLPFHGMSRYPYPDEEHYPSDPMHEQYRATYNTRPALRLLRPLAPDRTTPTGEIQ